MHLTADAIVQGLDTPLFPVISQSLSSIAYIRRVYTHITGAAAAVATVLVVNAIYERQQRMRYRKFNRLFYTCIYIIRPHRQHVMLNAAYCYRRRV